MAGIEKAHILADVFKIFHQYTRLGDGAHFLFRDIYYPIELFQRYTKLVEDWRKEAQEKFEKAA